MEWEFRNYYNGNNVTHFIRSQLPTVTPAMQTSNITSVNSVIQTRLYPSNNSQTGTWSANNPVIPTPTNRLMTNLSPSNPVMPTPTNQLITNLSPSNPVMPTPTNQLITNLSPSNPVTPTPRARRKTRQTRNKTISKPKKPRQARTRIASTKSSELNTIEEALNTSSECAICMTPFTGKKIGTPQNCRHNFCLDCLQKWSKVNSSCPLDRKKFNSIAVREEIGGRVIKRLSNKRKPKRRDTQRLTRNEVFLIGYNLEPFGANNF